jgi:hypothetical protein
MDLPIHGHGLHAESPEGTWRFELHYANAQVLQIYLGVWPPMTYLNGFYHAKYLPEEALPHVYVYGTQVQ